MKLRTVMGTILAVLLLCAVSSMEAPVQNMDFESGDCVVQSSVDWWPMFRHALNHSGYSTSTAPNTNNNIWSYTARARYICMGGHLRASTHLFGFPPTFWLTPYHTRQPYLTPFVGEQNITFSDPHPVTGVVNLTVPPGTFVGVTHVWFSSSTGYWHRMNMLLVEEGYGWLFTGTGSAPLLGDVDIITFNNDTGVYFFGPDGLAGTADDSSADLIASAGPDQIPGTLDDNFGTLNTTAGTPRTPDPNGSSILCLPTVLVMVDWWHPVYEMWWTLFQSLWPVVFTTATAYDIMIEPNSQLDGVNSTVTGEPWEFLAGLDQAGLGPVPYGHEKWNAYVKYVCAWSVIDQETDLGDLDVIFQIEQKAVREDVVIADADCNQKVNILDILVAAVAFGSEDEGPGPDGTPGTPDDKPVADPNFDARADMDSPGLISILDILAMAVDFGKQITPQCVIRP